MLPSTLFIFTAFIQTKFRYFRTNKNPDPIVQIHSDIVQSDTLDLIKYIDVISVCRPIVNMDILWSNTKRQRQVMVPQMSKSQSGPLTAASKSPLKKKSSSASHVTKKTKQTSFFSSKGKTDGLDVKSKQEIPVKFIKIAAGIKKETEGVFSKGEHDISLKNETKNPKPLKVIKVESKPDLRKEPSSSNDGAILSTRPEIVSKQSAVQSDQIKKMFEDDRSTGINALM
jgi:hypothetical protein